jgi:hypothetical protein
MAWARRVLIHYPRAEYLFHCFFGCAPERVFN